jgi:hypothetical protein
MKRVDNDGMWLPSIRESLTHFGDLALLTSFFRVRESQRQVTEDILSDSISVTPVDTQQPQKLLWNIWICISDHSAGQISIIHSLSLGREEHILSQTKSKLQVDIYTQRNLRAGRLPTSEPRIRRYYSIVYEWRNYRNIRSFIKVTQSRISQSLLLSALSQMLWCSSQCSCTCQW